MSEAVKDFFNQTHKYLHKEHGVMFRNYLVRKELGQISGKSILDCGCGNGQVTMNFLENNKVLFVDFSEEMLRLVKSTIPVGLEHNARTLSEDILKADLDEQFDIIVFIGVIANINENLELTLSRLKKLLKKGGILFFQYTDCRHWLSRIYRMRNSTYKVSQYNDSDISKSTEAVGLTIKKKISYATTLPGFGKLPTSLLYRYVFYISKFRVLRFLQSERLFVLTN